MEDKYVFFFLSKPNYNKKKKDESDGESEDPKLEDLLALDLVLQPEGVSPAEVTELDSGVKKEFSKVLNEPKKSLRRTFAYVGGIIRGYLRRGKSNINWIKIMRSNFIYYDLRVFIFFIKNCNYFRIGRKG